MPYAIARRLSAESCREAIESARDLSARAKDDRGLVLGHRQTTVATVRLFELLPEHPMITVKRAMRMLGCDGCLYRESSLNLRM